MWSTAPAFEPASYAFAVRRPEPVKMNAIELPDAQPERFTSAWTIGTRLGVFGSAPRRHRCHTRRRVPVTNSGVRGRAEMLLARS